MTKDLAYYISHVEESRDIPESTIREWLQSYPYSVGVAILKARKDLDTESVEAPRSIARAASMVHDLTFLKYQLLKNPSKEERMIEEMKSWTRPHEVVEEDNDGDDERIEKDLKEDDLVLDLTGSSEPDIEDQNQDMDEKEKEMEPVQEDDPQQGDEVATSERDLAITDESHDDRPSEKISSEETEDQETQKRKEAIIDQVIYKQEENLSEFTQWLLDLRDEPQAKEKKKKKKKKKKKSRLEKLIDESIAEKEDAVSETYAQLVAEQGYTDKAIEVYRQLQLKYPEKSGYFAAKIEELQKA